MVYWNPTKNTLEIIFSLDNNLMTNEKNTDSSVFSEHCAPKGANVIKTPHNEAYINRRNLLTNKILTFSKKYTNNDILAYTQTFKPSPFDHAPIAKQNYHKIIDLVIPLSSCSDYILLPEIHKSGIKYGSIHYHGMIVINDNWKWYNKVLPFLRTLGHVTIKPIFELTKWQQYLIKEFDNFLKTPVCEAVHEKHQFKKEKKIKEFITLI